MRLLALALLVISTAAAEPKQGGTLRVTLSSDISTMDPARCYELPGQLFVRVMYHCLVGYGAGIDLVPELARSWSVSSNGLEYTFHLDERARFSNGRPVVAADYLFSLERMLSPKMHCPADFIYYGIAGVEEFRAGKAEHIAGLAAPDEKTLKITLSKPDLTFLFRMAMPFAAAVCKEQLKDIYTDVGTSSAGAGPFQLKQWIRGAKIAMVRNEHYGGPEPAYLDGISATIGVDDSVAEMMFERGEIELADLKYGVAGAEYPRIMRTPSLRANLEGEPSSTIVYLAMNNEIPPFDNKLVRKAVNYAVNRKRLVGLVGGRAVEVRGVLPPVVPGYQPDLKGYEYSPETARRLLAEAGFPNGFTTQLVFNNSVQEYFRIVAAIQDDLRQVGINVEAVPMSFAAYLEKTQRRKAVPFCHAAWTQDFPDPNNYLDALLNGETIAERDCQNLAFYNNPEVNALLKQAATSLDMKERIEIYHKAENMVVDDAPWVFYQSLVQYCLHQPWVKNTRPHPVWPFRFDKMWMDR